MAAAPAPAAILGDILWCLGLGCLLAALRGGLGLLLGEGPLRRFTLDLLAFAVAAFLVCGFSAGVSASGLARWYMAAALGAGALSWQWAVQSAVRRALGLLAAALLWPLRQLRQKLLLPLAARLRGGLNRLLRQKRCKKTQKSQKNTKKQLQKPTKILYN